MTGPSPRPNDVTIARIVQALRQLAEGDRVTVLKFTQAIVKDRTAKRETRRKRFPQPEPDDSWRVGN